MMHSMILRNKPHGFIQCLILYLLVNIIQESPWARGDASGDSHQAVRVFIFAGQSNMEGADSNKDHIQRFPPFRGLDQPQLDVPFWYCLGRENKNRSQGWTTLQPVGSLVGPELSFAAHLKPELSGSLAIIKCAAGGTHLGGDWNPDQPSGFKMYPLLLQEVREALGQLTAQGVAYRLEGLVWHQGENDMFVPEYMARYGDHLIGFMDRLRQDLKAPQLPVFIGELCTKTIWGMDLRSRMYAISQGQKKAAAVDKHAFYVRNAHVGVEMGQPVGLHYHYGTLGQLEQGVEFAEAYLRHLGKGRKGNPSLSKWPYKEGQTVRLFILAGHRNMEGEWAFVQDLESDDGARDWRRPISEVAFKYTLGGGVWQSNGWEALSPAGLYGTFGPEVSFGHVMQEALSGPMGMLKVTHSGSQIIDWTPEGSEAKDRHFYPVWIACIQEAVADLEACGHPVDLAGVFYHLGENDMSFGPYRRQAVSRLKRLMEQTRADLKAPELDWFVSQQPPTDQEALNRLNVTAELTELAAADPHLTHIKVFDLPQQDRLLIGTEGIVALGKRLAETYLQSR